ncbi:MAG: hypothetical protein V7756_09220 [Halopseudomonas sp.]|uniref:HNH endonuclease n=1 Tax=Halopseudomonas sp. TaxID=2901191 RepID=UPI00300341D7
MIRVPQKPIFPFKGSLDKLEASGKSVLVTGPVLAQRSILEQCVKNYLIQRRRLEALEPFSFAVNIDSELISCYEGMPTALRYELDFVHSKVLTKLHKCLYCFISEPDSRDHYLPISEFPEFAFYIYNLIPCCSTCNRKKGKYWISGGVRLFVNPYFDLFQSDIFDATVSLKNLDVTYRVKGEAATNTVNSHVERLGLLSRYERQASTLVARLVELLSVDPSLNEQAVFKSEMLKEYNLSLKVHGGNYYETVFYKYLMTEGHDL